MAEKKEELDLKDEKTEDKSNPTKERIEELSGKVKTTATERDTEKARAEKAEKERDFFEGFSGILGTHPAAKDHKDEIKAKVLAGYTVEDATFAVLGKAGKIGEAPAQTKKIDAAGGSADVNAGVRNTGSKKDPANMTQAEKRAMLVDAERDGAISWQ